MLVHVPDVTCPRCGRTTDLALAWAWVGGVGERLTLGAGRVRASGHVDVLDLACGCRFDTELWDLRVSTSVSLRAGHVVRATVTSRRL
jgi:hypothetical protein